MWRAGSRAWTGCTLIRGHARFEGPHTHPRRRPLLEADRIFLNVGGRAVVPDIPGLADVDYLTNVGILDLDTLPEHLVIVGGSYIALEFAQMYRRFGARVTVVEKGPRLTSREDEDVSAAIKEILEAEGIDVDRRRHRHASHQAGQRFRRVSRATAPSPSSGTHLLMATGRRPNTDELGLEPAGVETDARGYITVDDQLRTTVEHIWAMGDCNGKGAFTHTSYNDFEIVAANLLDDDPRRVSDRITTYALYIDPPLGRAGMTVDEVRQSGRKALVGKRPMTRVGRAVEKGETQGFMKVVVDAETEQILGAAILGVGGDEVIQDILDVMTAEAAVHRDLAHHAHPPHGQRVGADDAAGAETAGLTARQRVPLPDASAPLHQQRLRGVPTKPVAVEQLRCGDADPVGSDRRRGPAARSRCRTAPVQVHGGVGVHEQELVGIQRRADAVGRVDDHGQPLHVVTGSPSTRGTSGLSQTRPTPRRVGGLLAANSPSPDSRGRPPTRAGSAPLAFTQRGMAVGRDVAGVAGGQQPRGDPGDRALGAVERSATSRRTSARCGHPDAVPRPEPARGATGMAPRMSRVSRPIRSGVGGQLLDGLGHQRQRR